ncbi:MAG: hypothetical protein C0399_03435 [Syntrophus sp. (in: bacteria)]|nr:hypothetical protein [Syntrophus sp. (in: bacteria)]
MLSASDKAREVTIQLSEQNVRKIEKQFETLEAFEKFIDELGEINDRHNTVGMEYMSKGLVMSLRHKPVYLCRVLLPSYGVLAMLRGKM